MNAYIEALALAGEFATHGLPMTSYKRMHRLADRLGTTTAALIEEATQPRYEEAA